MHIAGPKFVPCRMTSKNTYETVRVGKHTSRNPFAFDKASSGEALLRNVKLVFRCRPYVMHRIYHFPIWHWGISALSSRKRVREVFRTGRDEARFRQSPGTSRRRLPHNPGTWNNVPALGRDIPSICFRYRYVVYNAVSCLTIA